LITNIIYPTLTSTLQIMNTVKNCITHYCLFKALGKQNKDSILLSTNELVMYINQLRENNNKIVVALSLEGVE